jgi:hypothetical protein
MTTLAKIASWESTSNRMTALARRLRNTSLNNHASFVYRLTDSQRPVRIKIKNFGKTKAGPSDEESRELILDAISFRVHRPKGARGYGITPHFIDKKGISALHLGYHDMHQASFYTGGEHDVENPKPENHIPIEPVKKGLAKIAEMIGNYKKATWLSGLSRKAIDELVRAAKKDGGHDVTVIRFAVHDREHGNLNAREYWPYNPSEAELRQSEDELRRELVERMPLKIREAYEKEDAELSIFKSKSGRETTLYAIVKTKVLPEEHT